MTEDASVEALGEVRFDAAGLVPVIAQDAASGEVLMSAWADREALDATLATRQAHYHSRSRDELWRKGATSGNVQEVVEMRLDCDGDAVLYRVRQTGPACHTGARSCFFRRVAGDAAATPDAAGPSLAEVLELLQRTVDQRLADLPAGSYVARLHERGRGYVAQKVVEEAGETIVAALEGQDDELPGEAADLLFHLTVLLRERGLGLDAVAAVLARRHGESGDA